MFLARRTLGWLARKLIQVISTDDNDMPVIDLDELGREPRGGRRGVVGRRRGGVARCANSPFPTARRPTRYGGGRSCVSRRRGEPRSLAADAACGVRCPRLLLDLVIERNSSRDLEKLGRKN